VQSPPDVLVIEPRQGLGALSLRELVAYRELLVFLVWRDLKVRYKQTALGVLWVVLQPLINVVILSLLFGALLKVPSAGIPYPLFVCAGLLPWHFFATSLTRTSVSLVSNADLVRKVYFPRLIVPLASVASTLVDFAVAALVLIALLIYYRVAPSSRLLFVPAYLLLAVTVATGFGTWLAALNVRYRDVGHVIPFLLQVWMYLTPVAYGSTLLPERLRAWLWLNPMTSVVEGFRWTLTGSALPPAGLLGSAAAGLFAVFVLLTGLAYFRRVERTFADIA